ncbi:DUF1877 family protein [Catellatospora chokoriensis]|uniref:DUF1877 family protein n=1 Tax=Catellatospora chokoriensis TaxID=310353 RepID=A0A8J3NWA1_9ACTN|nr:DUF1877 family protein [Catellatospora chokoriensis]GIF94723.1 hypothetical protein Cch02nite_81670 [Catellatospora chokoriensis]
MTGVDMYWQRVPETELAGSPRRLWDGSPVFDDAAYERALADGTLRAVPEHYLLLEVLFAGSQGPGHPVAGLVVSGGAWHPVDLSGASDDEIGVLRADEVRAVSDFLRDAQPSSWIAQREGELSAVLRGYSTRPWDDLLARRLAWHADGLAAFYHRAAADGEAVVKVLLG